MWANSVDSDQTAPIGAIWSGSTLFAILSILLDTSKNSQTNSKILCEIRAKSTYII